VQDEIWQDFYNGIKDPSWPPCSSRYNVDLLPPAVQQDLRKDPRFDCYTEGLDLDNMRRLSHTTTTVHEDVEYTNQQIKDLISTGARVINSHVPNWHPTPLKIPAGTWCREFYPIDLARDGFHYDIKTAELFVSRILEVLEI
jgi:hypothetical protein